MMSAKKIYQVVSEDLTAIVEKHPKFKRSSEWQATFNGMAWLKSLSLFQGPIELELHFDDSSGSKKISIDRFVGINSEVALLTNTFMMSAKGAVSNVILVLVSTKRLHYNLLETSLKPFMSKQGQNA